MRRWSLMLGALCSFAAAPAIAGPAEEARALYAEFVTAQNAHDLAGVRRTFLDSPRFLWVTNGLTVWGADAAIARLTRFHANEVWRIEPDEGRSRAVEVNAATAFLNVPLVLVIG